MQMSLYPTDTLEVREQILAQAEKLNVKMFFVSLHIPEAQGLQSFIEWLQKLHLNKGYTFFADISPLTLERLNMNINNVEQLKKYGVSGVRIDFGFSLIDIQKIAATGLNIAINASTIIEADLVALAPLGIIGWHNYYPRPDTGMSEAYFLKQNALLQKYQIPIYTFIPGDTYLRAPLYLQLPMLEEQRGVDAYLNYLIQIKKYQVDKVFIAEGIIDETAAQYIQTYIHKQEITLPIQWLRPDIEKALFQKSWYIRIEETDISWRIEDTRAIVTDVTCQDDSSITKRTIGSIYMDNEGYGRYAGEIHLIHGVAHKDKNCNYVGEIHPTYYPILSLLGERPKIKFEKLEK